MAVKIRLARKGRKSKAYYHIVVADSRSPRDGRYIEKIGFYNPLTNPATIELDFDKALGWLQNGALPTDTCRAILSYKGVLMKKHLLDGVRKAAFDEAEAERRFEAWMKEHEAKIEAKRSGLEKSKDEELGKRLEAERKINEARAASLAKKQAAIAAKAEAESQPETEASAEASAEASTETAAETAAEPATEAAAEPAAEAAEVGDIENLSEAGTETDTVSEPSEPEEKPQE